MAALVEWIGNQVSPVAYQQYPVLLKSGGAAFATREMLAKNKTAARNRFIAVLLYCVNAIPYIISAFPGDPPRTLVIVAVPEHVALPEAATAVVGAAVAPDPRAVIVIAPGVPLDTAIVAVAVLELLNVPNVQVPVPENDPPLT